MDTIKVLFLVWICFLCLLCAGPAPTVAAPPPARVLLISSYHPGFPTFFEQINGIKSVFEPNDIFLDVEFMDKKRFADKENAALFLQHLTYKLNRIKPYDAVMTADDDALLFLLKHKERLFPSQPAVFLGVNTLEKAREQNTRNDITGVTEAVSMRETVQMMLALQPGMDRIVALADTTPSSMGDLDTFRQLAASFPQIVFFELSLGEHTFKEFAAQLQQIPPRTGVLLLSAYVDRSGERMLFEDSLKLIVANLQQPLFHLWHHGIGEGLLGGVVISHREQGKVAAELVKRILDGEAVESIKVIEQSPNIPVIDYTVLKRFNLDPDKVPKNTLLINKPFSLYNQYKYQFWLGTVFVVSQTLLILVLVSGIKKIKKTESALRESENRYASFFHNNHSIILLVNPATGTIVDINPAACTFYGYSRPDIVGKEITFLNPLPLSELKMDMEASRSRQRNHFFFQHRLASGAIRDVEVYSGPITVNQEQLLCSIVHDITERRRAEQAVRERELFLAAVLQTAAEGFWVLDSEGLITEVNGAYCAMSGFERQELINKPITALDAQWPEAEMQAKIHRIAATGSEIFETIHRRKDGSVFPIEISCTYLPENGGQFVTFCRDLTERKHAEDQLRTTLQRTQIILSNIQLGLLLINSDDKLEFINQACCDLLRFTEPPAELIGVSAPELAARALRVFIDPRAARVRLEKVLRSNILIRNEEVLLRDGRILLCDFVPILIEGKPYGRLWYYYDITKQRDAENDRKRLEQQLIQSQKMEAIGTLAGGIAHDFNNILSAVIGYAEMAKEASPAGSRMERHLELVLDAGHRAAGLVRQILAFSRQGETKPLKMEPALIIKEAVKLLRSTIPSTIEIDVRLNTTPLFIIADPVQLQQVVMNLCTNAFHAMEETGGTITLALQACDLTAEDLVFHPHVAPGPFVRFTVADTGPGIPAPIRQKIFEPYFTTKEIGKGTGLGLAIVHGIVSSSGGFVSYAEEPGRGAVFHLYFPAADGAVAAEPVAEPVPLSGNGHILFVDDEVMLAEMGEALLERLGYRVTVRTSSIEALATFTNEPDSFDAVITDQTMPGMTGVDLARRILQIRPQIPIILSTGFSNLVNEEQAKMYGIKGFLLKPITRKELGTLLKNVLQGRDLTPENGGVPGNQPRKA